jgi:hypothetical protein
MKTLNFTFRGQDYRVDEKGHINANGIGHFSDTWIFLGGSKHHWSNHIDVKLADCFEMPGLLNGCLGWDSDHGTTRRWGGQYYGRLSRINNAYVD